MKIKNKNIVCICKIKNHYMLSISPQQKIQHDSNAIYGTRQHKTREMHHSDTGKSIRNP